MMKMKVGILLMAVAVTANTEVVLANDDASETQKKTANAPAGPQVPVAVAVSLHIPEWSGHRFRDYPDTHSDLIRSPFPE